MTFSLRRSGIFTIAVLLALVLAIQTLPTPPAAGASPILQGDMIDLINGERASRGLSALTPYWDLEDDAALQTYRQVAKGTIFHTADLSSVVSGGWLALGENVGMGPTIPLLHAAFMDSPGHRANILGDWTHIGISVKAATDGQLFITVIFMKARGSIVNAEPLTSLPMLQTVPSDTTDHLFSRAVTWLIDTDVALGCSASAFCPDRPITRGEIATLLAGALKLPPASRDYFTDDNGSPHEANINAMAEAGITLGCNPPTNDFYCEQQTLTREEAASLLARALGLPKDAPDQFVDDSSSVHQANINALGARGITSGCNPPTNDLYCPKDILTRGQIAAFLRRALG